MIFENLKVGRIVVHEVFQREDSKTIPQPMFAETLEELSPEAMGAFRLRMTDALSGQSQSLEMRIAHYGSGSFLELAEAVIGADDQAFLINSQAFATKLTAEQRNRRIPGGMLIVFDGTVGARSIPFVGAIKAETQAGFRRSRRGERAVVEFLQNIFLTPATRLYKIGIMLFEDKSKKRPDGRRAFVFDSNITIGNREAAAAYFYEGFLGCALPSDGAYETRRFFDLTREFIYKSDLDPDKKRDIVDSLYVFVRDEQDPTFTADQFGSRYLPPDLQNIYADFLSTRKFSSNAVVRDVSQLGNRLRRRRFKFGADIELSASPDALKNKILIETVEGERGDQSGEAPRWTRVTIREAVTGEQ